MTRLPTFDCGSHLIYSDPVVMSAVRSLNKIRRVSGDMKEVCLFDYVAPLGGTHRTNLTNVTVIQLRFGLNSFTVESEIIYFQNKK